MCPNPSLQPEMIFGLDPGLRTTGWGVIERLPTRCVYIASGLIHTCPKQELSSRLSSLFEALTTLLETYTPKAVSVEEVFVNKNPESSLKLSMARGVTLCAPGRLEIPVFSYTANGIKKALVGHGHAEKQQVAWAVQQLLRLKTPPAKDAADALAVAICHAHTQSFFRS